MTARAAAAPAVVCAGDNVARLSRAAQALGEALADWPDARDHAAPDFAALARAAGTLRRPLVWTNRIISTPGIRRAHVEFFAIAGQIAVLHVCVLPALDVAAPIMGFDVISGADKATGLFLDLSPTVPGADAAVAAWGARARSLAPALGASRALPDWADIFSSDVVAVRPRDGEAIDAATDLARDALAVVRACTSGCAPDAMRAAQTRYALRQRENPHTRRMLAGCVGPALADRFVDEILFPLPESPSLPFGSPFAAVPARPPPGAGRASEEWLPAR